MCTLIVLHRCVAGRPLVVAANRDEFFDRPAEDIAIRASKTGPILSPLDLEAGGTWVGLSQRGVFAGLTNLQPAQAPDAGAGKPARQHAAEDAVAVQDASEKLKSRGGVVMTALESKSAADAIATLMHLEEGAYNPFQLLVADGRDAWLLVYRDRPLAIELAPGAHVVGNVEDEEIAAALRLDTETREGSHATSSESGMSGKVGSDGKRAVTSRDKSARHTAAAEPLPGFEGIPGLEGLARLDGREEPRTIKLTRIKSRVEKMLTDPEPDLFEGLARVCREHIGREHIDQADRPIERASGEIESETETESAKRGKGENETAPEGVGTPSPFEATCVHIADRYGTRSSLLLELSENPDASRLWTTDGPPCERPFENRSSLLGELGVGLQAGHAFSKSETETMRGTTIAKNW